MQSENTMISTRDRGYGLKTSPKDLVNHLKRKLQNPKEEYPLIPVLDVYQKEPEDLMRKYNEVYGISSVDEECCFFYPLYGRTGKGIRRLTPEGFWHPTGNIRKAQETDETKWAQRNLVYFRGRQKKTNETDWAMQEYMIESNPGFCLYHIHKKRRNKRRKKAESIFSKPDSSIREPVGCAKRTKHHQITTEAFVDSAAEPQIPSPVSHINGSWYSTSSPQLVLLSTPESLPYTTDTSTDSTESQVFSNPQVPQMYIEDQSPSFHHTSSDGSSQYFPDIVAQWSSHESVMNSQSAPQYHNPQHVVAQSFNYESPNFQSPCQHNLPNVIALFVIVGLCKLLSHPDNQNHRDVFSQLFCLGYLPQHQLRQAVFAQLNNFLSSNILSPLQYEYLQDVSAQLFNYEQAISHPQHHQMMPTEEMYPSIGNEFSNRNGSNSQMANYGQALDVMPSLSKDHGAEEINSGECLQFVADSQSREQLDMPLRPDSWDYQADGFRGGSLNALSIAQNCSSQQANEKVRVETAFPTFHDKMLLNKHITRMLMRPTGNQVAQGPATESSEAKVPSSTFDISQFLNFEGTLSSEESGVPYPLVV